MTCIPMLCILAVACILAAACFCIPCNMPAFLRPHLPRPAPPTQLQPTRAARPTATHPPAVQQRDLAKQPRSAVAELQKVAAAPFQDKRFTFGFPPQVSTWRLKCLGPANQPLACLCDLGLCGSMPAHGIGGVGQH